MTEALGLWNYWAVIALMMIGLYIVIARDNLFATQFHLEKSGELGLKLLGAFKHWDATC